MAAGRDAIWKLSVVLLVGVSLGPGKVAVFADTSCTCPPTSNRTSGGSPMLAATMGIGSNMLSNTEPTFGSSDAQATKPSPLWGSFRAPLPTNAWWTNLVTGDGDQPVSPLPYIVRAQVKSLAVSYPKPEVTATSVTYGFSEDLALGFNEAPGQRYLSHFDPLVTTMRWRPAAGSGMFDTVLARGSPYQTVSYTALTPVISTVHAIVSVNGLPAPNGRVITGTRFALSLNNGQAWIVYTAKPVTLTMSGTSVLTAAVPFSGVVRAAHAPNAAATRVLDANAGVYPAEGAVTYQMKDANTATVTFAYTAKATGGGTIPATKTLLTCVLPHHVDAKQTAPVSLQGAYSGIRGPLTCVAAPRLRGSDFGFAITEPLTTISWGAPRSVDADKKAAVAAALSADAGRTPVATDPYFFGKQVAAMGRLALIADELGQTDTATAIRGRMKAALTPWMAGSNGDPLRYDTLYGGICSAAGLTDGAADFGNGQYNDHLFHYGYFAYAAAALGRKDSAWLAANQEQLDDLLRDFANPRPGDQFFPFARQKDWFDGHSWASGYTPFAAGKNQESSSEAVNGYYGVYLLGLARRDTELVNWGRLLLAMELRSARKYYQIKPTGQQIYPPAFAKNGVVGVLWSSMVSYSTWFGANVEYIHGIQMLPFTPMSEALLDPAWAAADYPIVAKALPTAAQGWKGFIYMFHAVIDKAAAWREVQTLTTFDDGNSKTNTLWWVATRPMSTAVQDSAAAG